MAMVAFIAWAHIVAGTVWLIGLTIVFARSTHGLTGAERVGVTFGPTVESYFLGAVLLLVVHVAYWMRESSESLHLIANAEAT